MIHVLIKLSVGKIARTFPPSGVGCTENGSVTTPSMKLFAFFCLTQEKATIIETNSTLKKIEKISNKLRKYLSNIGLNFKYELGRLQQKRVLFLVSKSLL